MSSADSQKRGCDVDDCDRPHAARGKCGRHYRALLRSEGRIRIVSTSPNKQGNDTLRRGGFIRPQHRSPYNVLARTCPSCGDLLTTPDPSLRKDGTPLPRCGKCRDLEQSRRDSARQARSRETAERHYNEWTLAEMELAADLSIGAPQLAQQIGRTMYAVRAMRKRMREADAESAESADA